MAKVLIIMIITIIIMMPIMVIDTGEPSSMIKVMLIKIIIIITMITDYQKNHEFDEDECLHLTKILVMITKIIMMIAKNMDLINACLKILFFLEINSFGVREREADGHQTSWDKNNTILLSL